MKKIFIVPNNDAEAIRIQKLINENNNDKNYEILITGQDWGASWEKLESDIKNQIENKKNEDTQIYAIEIKGIPQSENIINVDHHKYYDTDIKTAIGEKTSIEQIAEILNVELSVFDKMVAANDVGYIPKMIKVAEELGISENEKARIIEEVNDIETIAKVVHMKGQSRIPIEDIKDIDVNAERKKNIAIAQEAIDKAYIYDERLIWIDLEDFYCQRDVTNILYKMGKYNDMSYNNIVISSIDKVDNRRLIYFGNREMIQELNKNFLEQKVRWEGGEQEQGFFGIQLEKNDEFEVVSEKMRYILEEKILGYHRIVKQEDIITSDEKPKYGNNIRVHEISNSKTFYEAINSAQDKNNYSAFVHVYEPEEYDEKKLFLVNAGCAGCAVKNDGDIVSVFKNDDMARKDDVGKISSALLLTAIENGGKKLDCYDGFLSKNYMQHGFIPVCKVTFNDEFAPESWNFERDGRPHIVFFRHNGDKVDEILKKKAEGTYTMYDLDKIPIIEDYDEAVAFNDAIIKEEERNKSNSIIVKDENIYEK